MNRAEAEQLAAERLEARAAKDFARADQLRDQIAEAGFDVKDVPGGSELIERAAFTRIDPNAIAEEPATLDASVHVLYEGHRSDLWRFIEAMQPSSGNFEIVVTDNADDEGERLESLAVGRVRVLHFNRELAWGAARNAAARASRGKMIVFADLSIEPNGDFLGPLSAALEDPTVGVVGGWGLTTENLHDFHDSEGPDVHAVEGYVMALRRDVFARAAFDPWFAWYRNADLDLSFRVRALGLRAVVVPLPAERHEHRGYHGVPEPERTQRSKRNFNRFLTHWRDRPDLLNL